MSYRQALLGNNSFVVDITNPLKGLSWALVVNRHVQAAPAADGASAIVEYERDITEAGFLNIFKRRHAIVSLGFDDEPTAVIGSPAKRCWRTAHGCAGLKFHTPDPSLYIPIYSWGWAKRWPEGEGNEKFLSLLGANKDKPVEFFLGIPDFGAYLSMHAQNAWTDTVEMIEENGGGLFFASGHSPTQDALCLEAVKGDPALAKQVLCTHMSYGQGWYLGSPDGNQMRFGWML